MIEFFKQNYQWIFSGIGISTLTVLYFVIKGLVKRHNKKRTSDSLSLLPKTIVKEVDSYPPLQRNQIEDSYKGIKVEWKTKFQEAHLRNDGTTHLMLLDRGSYPWVYCDVRVSDYPELKVIKEGTIIWVSGEIIKVVGNTITVKPTKLRFI
jgi:hypothetical protein